MKRSKASLADTPTGRPRHQTPRWLKRTFAVCAMLLVGRTVQGLWLPSLTPEQAADVDADAQYDRWRASPQGLNFEALRTAAAALRPDERAISNCWTTLSTDAGKPRTDAEIAVAVQDARRLLGKHRAALQVMREGYGEPFALPPLRTMNDSQSYLRDFRTLARLNVLGAELKRRRGQTDLSAQDLVYGLEYGNRLMRGSSANGRHVGIACQTIAARPGWKLLPKVSRLAYALGLSGLREAVYNPPVQETFAAEKRFGQRILLHLWGDWRGGKDAEVQPAFAALSLVWPRRAVFNAHTTYLTEWEKLSLTPYVPGEDKPPLPSDPVNRLFLPVFGNLRFRDVQARAANTLLVQAAEIYAYRAEKGRFPDRLEDLTPDPRLLARDPFGQNRPLRYRKQGSSFVLYSVGPDGKDDGGKPIFRTKNENGAPTRGRSAYYVDESSTGDMVGGVHF